MDKRKDIICNWFSKLNNHSQETYSCKLLFMEASNRRYFRITTADTHKNFVLLDSPTDTEPMDLFIHIGQSWRNNNIYVPEIYEYDKNIGVALLEDLGDKHLALVDSSKYKIWYSLAIDSMLQIQQLNNYSANKFNQEQILTELKIPVDWAFPFLDITPNKDFYSTFDELSLYLCEQLCKQPQVVIHRDYHSRNIMVKDNKLAIIDFQGTMLGPYTYDIMSLLNDAYKDIPLDTYQYLKQYFFKKQPFNIESYSLFLFHYSCSRLQRHLKILGIFCRLYARDKKNQYLQYLPRVCQNISDAIRYLEELQSISHKTANSINWLCLEVIKKLDKKY